MAPTPQPEGRFFCERCEGRYDEAGDCPGCPDEPLLDLLDEDVLFMLRSFDDERFRRRTALFSNFAGVLCAPLALLFLVNRTLGSEVFGRVTLAIANGLLEIFPVRKRTPDMGQHH